MILFPVHVNGHWEKMSTKEKLMHFSLHHVSENSIISKRSFKIWTRVSMIYYIALAVVLYILGVVTSIMDTGNNVILFQLLTTTHRWFKTRKRTSITITFSSINITGFTILTMTACFRAADVVSSCLTTLKLQINQYWKKIPFLNPITIWDYDRNNSVYQPKICTSHISKIGG